MTNPTVQTSAPNELKGILTTYTVDIHCLSMMRRWTPEEEVVLVYYASRYVRYASIVEILATKCNPGDRSIRKISHKVARLRRSGVQKRVVPGSPQLKSDRDWNREEADRWILRRMCKAELDILLDFDGYTAAIIDEMSDLNQFTDIMHLDDGGMAYWPSQFNIYYPPFNRPSQPNHLDHHDQPENTGGMGNMNSVASSDSAGNPDSMYNAEDTDSADTSHAKQPNHLDHHDEPENTGGMGNMNTMASSDSAGNPDSMYSAEDTDSADTSHAKLMIVATF